MRRFIAITFEILATLALAVSMTFAQNPSANGKKGEVELTAETRVGSVTLKPGHYVFQHQVLDGQHYLVVHAQATVYGIAGGTTRHWAGATKEEVARVRCRVLPGDMKQSATALHTDQDANGLRRVTQIAIAGEKGAHVILEPQA